MSPKPSRINKKTGKEEWFFSPEGIPPRSVALIHCVGSRNKKYNPYCSRVCCMYSLKFAHLIKEKVPNVNVYEFYIDMRAFGKGYEEFAERIKQEGTFIVRGHSASVDMNKRSRWLSEVRIYSMISLLSSKSIWWSWQLVLFPLPEPRSSAGCSGSQSDDDGWFSELDYNGSPTDTERVGFMWRECARRRKIYLIRLPRHQQWLQVCWAA